MAGKEASSMGVSVFGLDSPVGGILENANGNSIDVTVSYTYGFDVGLGVAGLSGADIEGSFNPDTMGINVEFSGAVGPAMLNVGVSLDLQGKGANFGSQCKS